MSQETFIRTYDDIVPASMCQQLIAFFRNSSWLQPGLAQSLAGDSVQDGHKVCDEVHIRQVLMDEKDEGIVAQWRRIDDEIFKRINPVLAEYITEFEHLQGQPIRDEGFRFKRYPRGQGCFKLHVDQTPGTPTRLMGVILYLNDVKEGGETHFPRQGVSVQPKAGRVVIAPAAWTHPHEGKMPISGDKCIVNNFAMFEMRSVTR